MARRLETKAAIVVGAGTRGTGLGNGKAAALQFGREGARVLCVDRDLAAAQATAKQIASEGGIAEAFAADVTNGSDCRAAVAECIGRFKTLDVLHNNVGIPGTGDIVDVTEAEWDLAFDVNVKGMFLMCKEAIPKMIEAGGGSIINVSSVASIRPLPDVTYVASKGAVDSLTRYIARRYGRYNIRANVLMLGYIDTPLARPAWDSQKVREINLKQVPMRRFARPEEVGMVAAFLASDEASYVNGVILQVDGGLCLNL